MKPELRFEEMEMLKGDLGEETCVPDLVGGLTIQNELEFHLDEEDEIFEGYGRRPNSYPYRQLSSYSRELKKEKVKTAVLENDYLKAVFLPEYGGRLWILWDKKKNRNLLYTNDVLRFSNLAVRNAWFSGGVEWNLGIIGHTPFTAEPLFTAELVNEAGDPVLRMYEYEQIRQLTYQMDFWLGEEDRFLNARIRIVNFGKEVVPMYWWSNIAVPEYKNGRVVVPAKKAYTPRKKDIYKVDIPVVEGIDISHYEDIPAATDYFFEIPKEQPKYITQLDETGYGLLQMSTNRLAYRKLFSWGHKKSSNHWQEFLTEEAGPYIEIQAGIGKTQYGCIPMAPNTAWEWLERYGANEIPAEKVQAEYDDLCGYMTEKVLGDLAYQEMEQILADTKKMAKTKAADLHQQGRAGSGALKNKLQQLENKKEISEHLDFGQCSEIEQVWVDFMETGVLKELDKASAPEKYMSDAVIFKTLEESIKAGLNRHWYGYYQLGLFYYQEKEYESAEKAFLNSISVSENPWAYHGLASVYTVTEEKEKAVEAMVKGIELKQTTQTEHGNSLQEKADTDSQAGVEEAVKKQLGELLSYVKEAFCILHMNHGFKEIIELYGALEERLQKEERIKFYYIGSLAGIGEYQKAYDLLCADGGLVIPDMREGEVTIGTLWEELHEKLCGEKGELPYVFDFAMN